MPSDEWNQKRLERFYRELRLESQNRNNAEKPKLTTDDVLETADFVFSPIKPQNRVGDSGNLLLAKRKTQRSEQYLVKHEYCDCASNEFVYSKLARAMGLRIPETKLFHISHGEKRNYFKTGYTAGARYLKLADPEPSYETIRECAVNWEDYHSFYALYHLFLESDSFEIVLADDGFLYRVDTTDSFPLGEFYLSRAGLDLEIPTGNIQDSVKRELLKSVDRDFWEYLSFAEVMSDRIARFGGECRVGFLKPFQEIQCIREAYIDDFLNTLCYFYPDFVGDCYRRFITAAQKKACEVLKQLS